MNGWPTAFHDGRHTAIITLAEKGLPDWVIQVQVGDVAPEMMKDVSHIRREAVNQSTGALESTATTTRESWEGAFGHRALLVK
jgi:hypothetical protein